MKTYKMISSKEEMKWFFDHCIFRPSLLEMYTLEFVCRHKKLTDEEKQTLGLTRKEAEFLATQTVRAPKVADGEELDSKPWTFDKFYRHVSRFECNVEGYTTSTGEPLPQKTLVILCYVNPGNTMKVVDKMIEKIDFAKSAIATALANGKTFKDVAQIYQTFTNVDSSIKHLQANCKGTSYWMDFDIDVPGWFRQERNINDLTFNSDGDLIEFSVSSKYYNMMLDKLNKRFGKGNYVIVSTSGGYHILVRTNSIKSNPHDFCKEVDDIYKQGVADGNPEYRNEKGELKYECTINDSQIPGIPLPGTFQYGRPVTVLNKDDFE